MFLTKNFSNAKNGMVFDLGCNYRIDVASDYFFAEKLQKYVDAHTEIATGEVL